MSVFESPLVRWTIGLFSASMFAAAGFFVFDGSEQLAVYAMAVVALVGEPFVLKQVAKQQ
jgi:hypothetical protein